jgi:1-acyl-sn-glycerol-3-phosphate acyltransferase
LKKPSLFGRFLYRAGKIVCIIFFKGICRRRVYGSENIPKAGAVIFASNHISNADPPLVGSSIPRTIHFMAKEELFKIPVLGWFISQTNAFPIRRWERDVSAFKTAQRILSMGEALILFPEGTRQRHGRFGKPKPGVGMLAQKSGAVVVPVYVHNSDKLLSFQPLLVCFGKPMAAEGETDYGAFAHRVMDAIKDLKDQYARV